MKIIYTILILFLFCISIVATAQSPYWQWAKSAGGTKSDVGNGISTDAKGNVYITGSFTSLTITFGSITLTNSSNHINGGNFFIVKYDSTGNVIWAKSAGGTGISEGTCVSVDGEGNIYVSGDCSGSTIFGSYTLTNVDSNSGVIFIVKYDSMGNVTWAKNGCSPLGLVNIKGISIDGNSNAYITGAFGSPSIIFGSDTLPNAGEENIFVAKYDSGGNVVWAKSGGGTYVDEGYGISTDRNGNAYVTGGFSSLTVTFGSITLTNYSNINRENVFVVKYDSAGDVIWAKSAGGIGDDRAFGISADASGNAYITGYFYSPTIIFGSDTLTNQSAFGNNNAFIVKYNATGNVLWAVGAGERQGYDAGSSISTDANASVYVTGYYSNPAIAFGSDTLTNTNGTNIPHIFVVKYDSTGNVIWAISSGAFGSISNISTDGSGNAYITGSFINPTLTFGSTTLSNNSLEASDNIFVAKVANCILPAPTNTTATSAQTICPDIRTTLTASGIGTFGWYSAFSGSNYLGSGSSFVTPALTTTTTFYVQDSTCGASNRTAITVTIYPKPNPIITQLSNDTLNTSTFASYQWLLNGAPINVATEQSYNATSTGNYEVAVIDTNGCTDTSAIYAFCILPLSPSNTTLAAAQTVCAGNSTTLSATGIGTLGWYSADSGGIYLGGDASFTTLALTTTTTFYVQDSTCDASTRTAITVTVYPKPNAIIRRLGNDTLTTGIFATYQWLVNGTPINAATEISYNAISTDNYQVVVTDTNGCTDTSAIYAICILPLSPSNTTLTAAQTICAGNSTTLSATGIGTLGWYSADSDGIYLGGDASFTTLALTTTTTLYVQDSTCDASTRTAITVTVYPKPNAIIRRLGNDTLTTGIFATYQWLLSETAINTATEQSYNATSNGNYQVAVSDTNECTDTSAIYNLTGVGISVINQSGNISLYPNPSNGNIYFIGVKSEYMIEIYDLLGAIIYTANINSNNYCVNLIRKAKGIYFYRIIDNEIIIQQGKIIID